MKTAQKGFTLIELMIVVAIIAILAAIAIPQYQTYVIRSQVTRAVAESGDLKTAVEDCLNNGKTALGQASTECQLGANGSNILDGAIQDGGTAIPTGTGVPQVTLAATGVAKIEAKFGNGASTVLTNGASKIDWDRTAEGTWTCTSTVPNAKYAPSGCPTTTAAATGG